MFASSELRVSGAWQFGVARFQEQSMQVTATAERHLPSTTQHRGKQPEPAGHATQAAEESATVVEPRRSGRPTRLPQRYALSAVTATYDICELETYALTG